MEHAPTPPEAGGHGPAVAVGPRSRTPGQTLPPLAGLRAALLPATCGQNRVGGDRSLLAGGQQGTSPVLGVDIVLKCPEITILVFSALS